MSNTNRLDTARRASVLRALAEGMSLRGTARLTGVARMTMPLDSILTSVYTLSQSRA